MRRAQKHRGLPKMDFVKKLRAYAQARALVHLLRACSASLACLYGHVLQCDDFTLSTAYLAVKYICRDRQCRVSSRSMLMLSPGRTVKWQSNVSGSRWMPTRSRLASMGLAGRGMTASQARRAARPPAEPASPCYELREGCSWACLVSSCMCAFYVHRVKCTCGVRGTDCQASRGSCWAGGSLE